VIRSELRAEYENVHGTHRALWPAQHPGVVLYAVPSSARGVPGLPVVRCDQ